MNALLIVPNGCSHRPLLFLMIPRVCRHPGHRLIDRILLHPPPYHPSFRTGGALLLQGAGGTGIGAVCHEGDAVTPVHRISVFQCVSCRADVYVLCRTVSEIFRIETFRRDPIPASCLAPGCRNKRDCVCICAFLYVAVIVISPVCNNIDCFDTGCLLRTHRNTVELVLVYLIGDGLVRQGGEKVGFAIHSTRIRHRCPFDVFLLLSDKCNVVEWKTLNLKSGSGNRLKDSVS